MYIQLIVIGYLFTETRGDAQSPPNWAVFLDVYQDTTEAGVDILLKKT